jgi:hypothetical protein
MSSREETRTLGAVNWGYIRVPPDERSKRAEVSNDFRNRERCVLGLEQVPGMFQGYYDISTLFGSVHFTAIQDWRPRE